MKLLHIKGHTDQIDLKTKLKQEIIELVFDAKLFKDETQSLLNEIEKQEFDGIILSEVIDGHYIGLEISLRIRLSRHILGEKIFKSIFVYHDRPASDILKRQLLQGDNTTATVLMTIGVFSFGDFDILNHLVNNTKNFNLLNESNYKSAFGDLLVLRKPKEFGNHSLANIWGAYRLAEVTGHLQAIKDNPRQLKFKDDLYMLHLKASQPKNVADNKNEKKTIQSFGKKILLIDDESDKGWHDVLKMIFTEATFEIVKKEPTISFPAFYENALLKARESVNNLPKWDLILLDLRLDESEDFGDKAFKQAEDYSGAKLLQEIKSMNKGIQVIMFTASNKSWNMRDLINLGADGYYVKESPESNYDIEFSLRNFNSFKIQAEACYNYNFLKEFYYSLREIEDILIPRRKKDHNNPLPKDFVDDSLSWLRLGIENISKSRNHVGHVTSFLVFFSVLDNLSNRIINIDNPIKVKSKDDRIRYMFEFRVSNQSLKCFTEDKGNPGFYKREKWKLETTRNIPWTLKILNTFDYITNEKIDMASVNKLIKKRNDIIHANSTTGDKINISSSEVIILFKNIILGLRNVK